MATQAKVIIKGENNLSLAVKSVSHDLSYVFLCYTKWYTV